jgi:hypothetical protein
VVGRGGAVGPGVSESSLGRLELVLLVVNRRGGRDCGLGPLARLDAAGEGLGEGRGADIVEVLRLSTRYLAAKYTFIPKIEYPSWLDSQMTHRDINLKWSICRKNGSSSKVVASSTLIYIGILHW